MAAAPHLPGLRRAIRLAERLEISDRAEDGHLSRRMIRPLVLEFGVAVSVVARLGADRQSPAEGLAEPKAALCEGLVRAIERGEPDQAAVQMADLMHRLPRMQATGAGRARNLGKRANRRRFLAGSGLPRPAAARAALQQAGSASGMDRCHADQGSTPP